MHYVLAQVLYLAAESGGSGTVEEPKGIDLVIPEINELIAGVVAFAIVFFFVWRFAIPALNKTLEGRQSAVKQQLDAAENSKVEAESLLQDYRSQLAGSRDESTRIIEEARRSGEALKADIVAKAELEAAEVLRKARGEAAAEKARVATALRSEVATLSLDVAERVVGAWLDRSSQQALVDRFIDELGGIGN